MPLSKQNCFEVVFESKKGVLLWGLKAVGEKSLTMTFNRDKEIHHCPSEAERHIRITFSPSVNRNALKIHGKGQMYLQSVMQDIIYHVTPLLCAGVTIGSGVMTLYFEQLKRH